MVLAFLLVILVGSVTCVLVDQDLPVYSTTGQRPQFVSGIPHTLVIATSPAGTTALNPGDGTLVWRLLAPAGEELQWWDSHAKAKLLATVSRDVRDGALHVRMGNLASGRLLWERSLPSLASDNQSNDLRLKFAASMDTIALLAYGHGIQTFDAITGTPYDSISLRNHHKIMPIPCNACGYLGWISLTQENNLTKLEFNTNKAPGHQVTPKSWITSLHSNSSVLLVSSAGKTGLVLVDAEGVLRLRTLDALNELEFSTQVNRRQDLEDVGLAEMGYFLAKEISGRAEVWQLLENGTLRLAWTFTEEDEQAHFSGSVDRHGVPHIGRVSYAPEIGLASLQILSLDPDTRGGPFVFGQTFPLDVATGGGIRSVSLQVAERKDYVPLWRLVVVTENGNLEMWQGGTLLWRREPAAASLSAIATRYDAEALETDERHVNPNPLARILSYVRSGGISGPLVVELLTSSGANYLLNVSGKQSVTRLVPNVPSRTATLSKALVWRRPGDASTMAMRTSGRAGGKSTSHETRASTLACADIISLHDQDMGAAPGRVTGSRDTVFKYHNPQTATCLRVVGSTHYLDLLDLASGQIVASFEIDLAYSHQDSLRIAQTDNWIVIAMPGRQSSSTLHSVMLHAGNNTSSRRASTTVNVVSKSFRLPCTISNLGVSHSTLGVTSRSLLVATSAGQVFYLPQRLLDPRRPATTSSKEGQEEQLLPYQPNLQIDARNVLSSSQEVFGVRKIEALPMHLESTVLLVATGQDVYAKSFSPSRAFDCLDPTFNKTQLVVTIMSLICIISVFRSLLPWRKINHDWAN